MLAIECNPRLHSNITLMDTRRGEAAEAIYRAMETEDMNNNEDEQTIAVPDSTQKHVIWTYNELAKLLHGEGETCQFVNKDYPKSFFQTEERKASDFSISLFNRYTYLTDKPDKKVFLDHSAFV